MIKEIVFLDVAQLIKLWTVSNMEHYRDNWISDMSHLKIIHIENSDNGLQIISDSLEEHDDITALHIITHADAGRVKLGNVHLGMDNIKDYQDQISFWSQSLQKDAEILFYGCMLAATQEGKELVDRLAQLTQAKVAACINAMENILQKGYWSLDYQTGPIQHLLDKFPKDRNLWFPDKYRILRDEPKLSRVEK